MNFIEQKEKLELKKRIVDLLFSPENHPISRVFYRKNCVIRCAAKTVI